jgi:hypothetical protein
MMSKYSDQVRSVARAKYVEPALHSGKREFAIRVRDMLDTLVPLGFPVGNTNQICEVLQKPKFLGENSLEIVGVDGPPSKRSTTVVVKYRVVGEAMGMMRSSAVSPKEDSKERAKRLTENLRGLLKVELAGYGGGEAFLKWVRSEDEVSA